MPDDASSVGALVAEPPPPHVADAPLAETPIAARAQPEPATTAEPRTASLYRIVWRWHFYAGMLVAPVGLVVALTGAIYVFKDEIEGLFDDGRLYVAVQEQRQTLQAQVDAARATTPGFQVEFIELPHARADSTKMFLAGPDKKRATVYVNPYDATVLATDGEQSGGFFAIVLKIHRQLFLGTTGRVLVELTTSWMIVLLITGVYLWWPRGNNQVWGVWLMRLRGKPYVALRDLHAVAGALLSPCLLIIALTGLFWAVMWSAGLKALAAESLTPIQPKAKSTIASGPDIPVDQALAVARQYWPDHALTVALPKKPDDTLVVRARPNMGPTLVGMVEVDRYTGAELRRCDYGDLSLLGQIRLWVYPLHVGSVCGLPTKILAFTAALVMVGLTITGVWMWWTRRPEGHTGFPKKPAGRAPRWIAVVIVALAIYLPAFAISVIAIVAGDWGLRRALAWRRNATQIA